MRRALGRKAHQAPRFVRAFPGGKLRAGFQLYGTKHLLMGDKTHKPFPSTGVLRDEFEPGTGLRVDESTAGFAVLYADSVMESVR